MAPDPEIVRWGCLVRVGGRTFDDQLLMLVFADLRFPGGRVERWIGPGRPAPRTTEGRGERAVLDAAEWNAILPPEAFSPS